MKKPRLNGKPICPFCSAPLNGQVCIDGDAAIPEKGDFTLCAYCVTMLRYSENLSLRAVVEEDLADLTPEQIKEYVFAIKFFIDRAGLH